MVIGCAREIKDNEYRVGLVPGGIKALTKNTGNGHREACDQALDVFSEWKSIYIDYSGTLQRAQIDA